MIFERRLTLHELSIPPSVEWAPKSVWILARIVEGTAYWLPRGASARELQAGDVVAAAAQGGQSALRSSRLGPAKIQYFLVDSRALSGLLSIAEGRQLEKCISSPVPYFRVFGPDDPVAKEFARIASQPGGGLSRRCALLRLWVEAIAGLLASPLPESPAGDLHERFRRLIGDMSETELIGCSPAALASRLHCSERHLGRLFREEFGVPLHRRQMELRLLHARQLLANSDEKIITVAYESGFHHLGHFNAMFKRRFGMTPSEWRHQQIQKHHVRPREQITRIAAFATAMVVLFLGLALPAFPQTKSPDAAPGAKVPSASAPTNTVRSFEVQHYDVEGNTVLKPDIIGDALARGTNAFGRAVTIEDIRAAVGRLQAAYRERGYVTVSVTLPQQQITNATIKIRIIEGTLAAINVTGNRYFSSNNVLRALPGLRTNMLLNSHVLQREMDAANENKDRQIYPVIGPGPDPGTSSLQLKVKDRLPLHVHLELNNVSTPGTPDLRMVAAAQYNNLWDLEHQVGVQYSFSPEKQKLQDIYSSSPFDSPLIANYSGYYRMPLGGLPSVQEQIDSNPSTFGYSEVTHQFRLPPAAGHPEIIFYASRATADTGLQFGPVTQQSSTNSGSVSITTQPSGENFTLNENLGTRISLPLPEVSGVRGTLSFGLDFKRYRLSSFNTNTTDFTTVIGTNIFGPVYTNIVTPIGSPPRYASVDYVPFNVGYDAAIPDKFGMTFFNANSSFNVFHSLSGNADFSNAAYTTNARYHYVTVNMGVSREQKIYKEWSILFRANGQWADGPLISNEQFAMGGTMGVRGYREGEVYGDSGWRVTVEPHTPYINLHATTRGGTAVPFLLRGSVFIDYGQIAAEPAAGFNHVLRFAGAGFGVTGQIENHLDARLTVAWPMLRINDITPGATRVYFGLGVQF